MLTYSYIYNLRRQLVKRAAESPKTAPNPLGLDQPKPLLSSVAFAESNAPASNPQSPGQSQAPTTPPPAPNAASNTPPPSQDQGSTTPPPAPNAASNTQSPGPAQAPTTPPLGEKPPGSAPGEGTSGPASGEGPKVPTPGGGTSGEAPNAAPARGGSWMDPETLDKLIYGILSALVGALVYRTFFAGKDEDSGGTLLAGAIAGIAGAWLLPDLFGSISAQLGGGAAAGSAKPPPGGYTPPPGVHQPQPNTVRGAGTVRPADASAVSANAEEEDADSGWGLSTLGFGTVGTTAGGWLAERYARKREEKTSPARRIALEHLAQGEVPVKNWEAMRQAELKNVSEVANIAEEAYDLLQQRDAKLADLRKFLNKVQGIDWQKTFGVSSPDQITMEHLLQKGEQLRAVLLNEQLKELGMQKLPHPMDLRAFNKELLTIAAKKDPAEQARLLAEFKERLKTDPSLGGIKKWLTDSHVDLDKADMAAFRKAIADVAGKYNRYNDLKSTLGTLEAARSLHESAQAQLASLNRKITPSWAGLTDADKITEQNLLRVTRNLREYRESVKNLPVLNTSEPDMGALARNPAQVAGTRKMQIDLPERASLGLRTTARAANEWLAGWDTVGQVSPLERRPHWGARGVGAAIGLGVGLGLDYLIRNWVEGRRREVATPGGRE